MKQKDILFIFISSFVVVAAWVGFNLYHKWVTTTISQDLQIQINQIESNFDRDTIEKLKKRNRVSPAFEIDGSTKLSPTQQPNPSATPTPVEEQPVEQPPVEQPTLEPTQAEQPPAAGAQEQTQGEL